MDEINNKLEGGNPIVTAQIVSKLVQIIKSKKDQDVVELPEFRFLKQKCISNNGAVNVVAAQGVLDLVSWDQSLIKPVISDFVSIITTMRCSPHVTFLINNLLVAELRKDLADNESYRCYFNLRLPQHPFLIMLGETPECWPSIFREIVFTYKTADNEDAILHYNDLYKSVFLYALCAPHGGRMLDFQQKLWTFLVQKEAVFETRMLDCLVAWMQFENRDCIQANSDFLVELGNINRCKSIFEPELSVLWQTGALYQLIVHNFDPRDVILSLVHAVEGVAQLVLNPVLFILAKCVAICPGVYLEYLLSLCRVVISRAVLDVVTCNILISALLQWITNPSELVKGALGHANNIFSFLQSHKTSKRLKGYFSFKRRFQSLLVTNGDVYFSMHIYTLIESWKSDHDVLTWLTQMNGAPSFFLLKTIELLVGLFLADFADKTITRNAFALILRCVESNTTLASDVLAAVLFKLTNVTDSQLHLELLKAVPAMAVTKSNFQKVVSTIQALNKGDSTLKSFSMTLMLELWRVDNKCYPYLEKLLIEGSSDRWEFVVSKAYVLKELCALKPELYGKELVAHLSKVLNECNNPDGALPSALAVDGITSLCKSEIIDAVTTWTTLAPMFKAETRVPVIRSMCALISEIPTLSYSEAYPKLLEEVVAKLWEYLTLNYSDEVWGAALGALTHFSVEQIVAGMPEEYLDEESLNVRKGGHVVPGHCWIHFLKSCTETKLPIVGDFLIKLMSQEISNYLKFVYQVKGTREPVDYSYLPINSVVRGLSTHIKSKILKWKGSIHEKVYLQCLRIFSQEYSKPLPPLDWCFLQELFHESQAKDFCVHIAAHQVVLSGTARRFIVNYIEAVTQLHEQEDRDVLLIYHNLRHVANSIQPLTMKPFFELTILKAVELYKNGREGLLVDVLRELKDTLRDEDVQEANKLVVAEIIGGVCLDVDVSSKLFDDLLECIILFPAKSIDDLSSPKSIKEVRADWFKKAVRIRCCRAARSKNAPLNLLNDLIEAGSVFPTLRSFFFDHLVTVFATHKDNTECVLWLLDLIGQIQAVTAEKSEKKEVFFLCNVFILATVVFSGHGTFLKDFTDLQQLYRLFPRAAAALLDVNHWSICTTQALEWFYYMTTEGMFAEEYGPMFLECLQALRHESEFQKTAKWTKYLNVAC